MEVFYVSEIDNLLNDIEKLRKKLLKMIDLKDGDLLDPDVLSASKLLNATLTEYDKLLEKKIDTP